MLECCGNSYIQVSKSMEFNIAQLTNFSSGLCHWVILPGNSIGGFLSLATSSVQFDSSTSCETDYVVIYNNTAIEDEYTVIGK